MDTYPTVGHGALPYIPVDLLERIRETVIAIDPAQRVIWLNAAAARHYGVDPVAARGQPLTALYECRWLQPADEAVATAALAETGRWYGENIHLIRSNGATRYVETTMSVLVDAAGQSTGLLLISGDIAERILPHAPLQTSEAQLNAILYNIPAAVYLLTTDHRYLLVNRIYEQENQITNAEIRGLSIYDRWPLVYAEGLVANERRVLATKAPIKIEEVVPRATGLRYYETIKAPLLDPDGEPYAIVGISTDITERKAAEAALRQSEERYRTLFETMDEGFCVFELIFDEAQQPFDYRFLEANPAFTRLTGLADVVGKTARQLLPNLEARWLELYGRVALTGEACRFIEGAVAMGHWFEVYAFRFGTPAHCQVALLFTNITERKVAEDQSRRQEELLRLITDNVPGLIAYVGKDERYRFVNATFESWFQRPRQQIIDSTVRELIGDKERARLSTYRQQALAGNAVSYETRFTYPDGITRTVWGRYQPHFAADGTVLGFYLIVMDISERQQAEAQLRASEERFRQLAEAMPQIVWAAAADGALTYINAQWQAYSGMTDAETLQQGLWPALHPADQVKIHTQWQQALTSGQPYEAELRLRRADGEYRWHLERAVPICTAAGTIAQWFGVAFDIDDHKRVQEALARANERFALAEHASNGWVYDFDVQRATVERSAGFYRILGYAATAVPAEIAWWHNLFHPDDRHLVAAQAIRTRSDAEFAEVEYRIRHRDGHYVHLLDRSRNIHNAAGQRVRVVGITVDISARKRAELHQQFLNTLGMQVRLLHNIETIMAHLVESLGHHLGVTICRLNEIDLAQHQFTIQQEWSPSDRKASGVYPLTELAPPAILAELQAGQTVVIVNTATDPRTAAGLDNYRKTETVAFIGVPIFRQGQWSATLSVRDQRERQWHPDEIVLLETVATHFQPLLEKVRAEQALRHSEERLRLALTGGGMGIWEWEIATDTSTWTEQEYALFGLPPTTPITSALFASLIHADDQLELLPALRRLMVHGGDYTGEFRVIHPDGQVRWLAERCLAICDAHGQPLRLLGINFDITERKAIEHALQQFNAQLEAQVRERTTELTKRLQELDQFAYVASHDLRAPLRAIDHLAQWISEDAARHLPPTSRRHLETMHGRITRMEQLLNDLLAYSRADRYQFNLAEVDVARMLEEILRLVAPPAGFVVSAPAALPLLVTQKVPLETVLRNLIQNAIKHHDRTAGHVQVTAQDLGDFVEFSVSDDGPGIAPEFHERIFQIFQTLKPRDQIEGSGMGLAIVKKTVEHRGGTVRVVSDGTRGTTFAFTWPKEGHSVQTE